MENDLELIAGIQALYDNGLFVQAYHKAAPLGAFQTWKGTSARILGARLASQLSADRLSDALFLRTWRADRSSPEALYYASRVIHSTRGPLAALDMLNSSRILEEDSSVRWEAVASAAYLYAQYRDFETAERLITLALDNSGISWIWSQRAAIYEMEDKYKEAMDASRRALEINPRSTSAIHYTARFLSLSERDGEAIALLREAIGSIESAYLAVQLTNLEIENGFYREALATLERYDGFALLKDKRAASWLAERRCDIYSHIGDNARALEQAKLSISDFYKRVAERLTLAEAGARRVLLPVGFVRQHHMTCAPATMSALGRFWSRPTDHLELAEEICYDGTSHQSQRRWALDHGWCVREFTVTWDSTQALIDAGIPFALTSVSAGSSHLQAVIGYDGARGVLFIRDPYERVYTEFSGEAFFASQASEGPRGMVMIPEEERGRLEGIQLPEAELYDLAYDMQLALLAHERDKALEVIVQMEQLAPGHRITISARRSLAKYDGDILGQLSAVDQLLEKFPEDVNMRLSKAWFLQQVASYDAYLTYVEQEANGKASHPLIELRRAQAMLEDGRTRADATRMLGKLVRRWNTSNALSSLADAHWHSGDYGRAVFLYRLASSQDEANEGHARAYFRATRMVREEERALAFLRERIARLGDRSPNPYMTLFNSLDDLERTDEAREVRDEALQKHPSDGELLLFAAQSAGSVGEQGRSDEFLARAKDHSKPVEWMRAAARQRDAAGDTDEALRLLSEVVRLEPLGLASQRAFARLLAGKEGRESAIRHLHLMVQRFPHHQEMNELLVDWMDEEPLPEQENALRNLVSISQANAWAQRQLAIILAKQRRFDEAREHLELARMLAPNSSALHSTEGLIELLGGHLKDARAAFRKALQLEVDSDYAFDKLMEACGTLDERRVELAFVLDEMKRQVVRGDSLLNFQRHALSTLETQELADFLDEARSVRPDLWQAWVACSRQRMEMQEYETARKLCLEALKKFPVLPRLHVELADIARLMGDRAAEIESLREALRLNPAWAYAARKLADALESEGDFAASRILLEKALRHSPADSLLHGYLGHALWQLHQREDSVMHLEKAVSLDPGYNWAWRTLKDHAAALGRPDAALSLARKISERRAGELRSWIALAAIADDPEERLTALDRAITLAPLNVDPYADKIDLLLDLKRYDEALKALGSTAWGDKMPVALRIKETQVVAAQGEIREAAKRLREILADDPNHYAGWAQLADWRDEYKNYPAYLEAAREMVRIAPNNANALGYLSDALRKSAPGTDTRQHLRRAQHLRPEYSFAGYALFEQEMDAGNFDLAEEALATLEPHLADTGGISLRRLRLALRRGAPQAARDQFGSLLESSRDNADLLREAMSVWDEAGQTSTVDDLLDQAIRKEGANPHLGTLWVERRARQKFALMRFYGFSRVLMYGEAGQYAAQALLRHYAKQKAKWSLRLMLRKHMPQLCTDDTTHGLISYALISINAPAEVVKRFGDWRQRPGVESWALLNLSSAQRDLGGDEEAHAISKHALTLKPDHASDKHKIWLALDYALAGERAEAEAMLSAIDESSLNNYFQFVIYTTRAILAMYGGESPDPKMAFSRARFEIKRANKVITSYANEPALRRASWRAMWKISRMRSTNPAGAVLTWLMLAIA